MCQWVKVCVIVFNCNFARKLTYMTCPVLHRHLHVHANVYVRAHPYVTEARIYEYLFRDLLVCVPVSTLA